MVYCAEDEFTEAYYTIMTRSERSERLYEKILPNNNFVSIKMLLCLYEKMGIANGNHPYITINR